MEICEGWKEGQKERWKGGRHKQKEGQTHCGKPKGWVPFPLKNYGWCLL